LSFFLWKVQSLLSRFTRSDHDSFASGCANWNGDASRAWIGLVGAGAAVRLIASYGTGETDDGGGEVSIVLHRLVLVAVTVVLLTTNVFVLVRQVGVTVFFVVGSGQ
jgi:hypothetical protein